MKAMSISSFKSHALRVVDNVATTGEEVLITRRGKPMAEVIPVRNRMSKPLLGKLAATLVAEKDIVTPLGAQMWEVGG